MGFGDWIALLGVVGGAAISVIYIVRDFYVMVRQEMQAMSADRELKHDQIMEAINGRVEIKGHNETHNIIKRRLARFHKRLNDVEQRLNIKSTPVQDDLG